MKKIPLLLVGIILIIGLAVGGYFWAMGMFSSNYDYRSPLKNNPPAPGAALGAPQHRPRGDRPGGWTAGGYGCKCGSHARIEQIAESGSFGGYAQPAAFLFRSRILHVDDWSLAGN